MSDANETTKRPHVVIVGGGFGGLWAARALSSAPVKVTVIDKENHHLFQPLLYQVATAALAGPDIATPIRRVLRRQKNARVILDEVVRIDPADNQLHCARSGPLPYDALIVAAGATHSYFGNDAWAEHAPGLKTLSDAMDIRRRMLVCFEEAERLGGGAAAAPFMRFVVVGAGPTGVELAGAIAEIATRTLANDFRAIRPEQAEVVLVEGGPRVLAAFSEDLSEKAASQLRAMGVTVRLDARVTKVDENGVMLGHERLESRCVLWGAGNRASPLGASLGERDKQGRVKVRATLQTSGFDNVYVVGDLAHVEDQAHGAVPSLAPAAIQMGGHAAKNVVAALEGTALLPFRYRDKGSLATIGRKKAVGYIGSLHLSGLIAWLGWLLVHLFFLVGFRNRVAVFFEWAYAYLSFARSARVFSERRISAGENPTPPRSAKGILPPPILTAEKPADAAPVGERGVVV